MTSTGLVALELYKLLLQLPRDKFLSANVNLGTSTYELFELQQPIKAQPVFDVSENETFIPVPPGWTSWDKVVIDVGDLTVAEFLERFPEFHHGCTCESLTKVAAPGDELKVGFLENVHCKQI